MVADDGHLIFVHQDPAPKEHSGVAALTLLQDRKVSGKTNLSESQATTEEKPDFDAKVRAVITAMIAAGDLSARGPRGKKGKRGEKGETGSMGPAGTCSCGGDGGGGSCIKGLVKWSSQSNPHVDTTADGTADSLNGGGNFEKMAWSEDDVISGPATLTWKCSDQSGYTVVALHDSGPLCGGELTGTAYGLTGITQLLDDGTTAGCMRAYCRGTDKVYFWSQNGEETSVSAPYTEDAEMKLQINQDKTVTFSVNGEVKGVSTSVVTFPLKVAVNFGNSGRPTGKAEGLDVQC